MEKSEGFFMGSRRIHKKNRPLCIHVFTKRGYKFSYDAANRLTSGAYGEGDAIGSNTGRYSESMSYDANGNVYATGQVPDI